MLKNQTSDIPIVPVRAQIQFYECNGCMDIQVDVDGNTVINLKNNKEGILDINWLLPANRICKIIASNKNYNKDTHLSNGLTVKDKKVILRDLNVNNLSIQPYVLQKLKFYTDQNKTIYTNEWGFNGYFLLQTKNPLEWHLQSLLTDYQK